MIQQNLYGYICTDDERIARRYIAPVILALLQIGAFIFILQVFQTSDLDVALVLVASWIIFILLLVVSYYSVRVADRLAFCLDTERITNSWPKDNILALDLHDSYFCARFTCTFAYGKASKEKSFYLFSATLFPFDYIEGAGLKALENIHKRNIIIIPKTEAVDEWIKNHLSLSDIPEFPAFIQKTIDKT